MNIVELSTVTPSAGAAVPLVEPRVATFHDITLDANCTITFPAVEIGASLTLLLRQGGAGGWLVTWDALVEWPNSVAPTLTTDAGKLDILSFVSDGAVWLGRVDGAKYL